MTRGPGARGGAAVGSGSLAAPALKEVLGHEPEQAVLVLLREALVALGDALSGGKRAGRKESDSGSQYTTRGVQGGGSGVQDLPHRAARAIAHPRHLEQL